MTESRRAYVALAVALAAAVAGAVGLREAVRRMPAVPTGAAADSLAAARADSQAAARRGRGRPGAMPGGRAQPTDLPRLR